MADNETKKHWLEEKIISVFFGVIITGIVGFAGFSVVSSIDNNTNELKLLRGDLNEINIVYNNKFHAVNTQIFKIDSKITSGRERGSEIVREFREEFKKVWQAIEELKK
jgi:hypothetical protein